MLLCGDRTAPRTRAILLEGSPCVHRQTDLGERREGSCGEGACPLRVWLPSDAVHPAVALIRFSLFDVPREETVSSPHPHGRLPLETGLKGSGENIVVLVSCGSVLKLLPPDSWSHLETCGLSISRPGPVGRGYGRRRVTRRLLGERWLRGSQCLGGVCSLPLFRIDVLQACVGACVCPTSTFRPVQAM